MDLNEIGQLVRHHRQAQGLNLEELSRLSGVGISTLSNLENGSRNITMTTLGRIAEALRLHIILDLKALEPSPPPPPGSGYDDLDL